MGRKHPDPRDIDVYEIVDIIKELADEPSARAGARGYRIIAKLVGEERMTGSRWSSKHIIVGPRHCRDLAEDLGIGYGDAVEFFLGETLKRAQNVAAWALDQADETILENGSVYGNRGRIVAKVLKKWAVENHAGMFSGEREASEAREINA